MSRVPEGYQFTRPVKLEVKHINNTQDLITVKGYVLQINCYDNIVGNFHDVFEMALFIQGRINLKYSQEPMTLDTLDLEPFFPQALKFEFKS